VYSRSIRGWPLRLTEAEVAVGHSDYALFMCWQVMKNNDTILASGCGSIVILAMRNEVLRES
jgi:hypothetical protein